MEIPQIFGRYQPLEVLASGAASRVLRVRDLLDGEVRALKVLLNESGSDLFFREFEILASIQHPLVVKVFDFGQDNLSGLRYFTMEYLHGRPLSELVPTRPSFLRISRIISQILSALSAIHARGILHADLKPQNIYLLESADEDCIKLLDFGLAGLRTDQDPGSRRGTLPYMAPEWFQSSDVDHRSDLYSTGVILYELLSGKTPFDGLDTNALIRKKIDETIVFPLEVRTGCPPELERLALLLLERDPALRPPTAVDTLSILENDNDGTLVNTASSSLVTGMPLTGRSSLMACVESTFASVNASAAGHFIFLTAEAGGGKSRLLSEIRHQFRRNGVRVLEMKGGDKDGQPPLRQLFFEPVRLETETHRTILARHQSPIRQLFGEASQIALSPGFSGAADQLGLVDGLTQLLLDLATRHPLVVLVDDLHRADPLTLLFLTHLGWRLDKAPLLVCATADVTFVESNETLLDLTHRSDVEVKTIEPLTTFDMETLLAAMFGAVNGASKVVSMLEALTAGNPGMLGDLLVSLVEGEAIFNRHGRWFVSEQGLIDVGSAAHGIQRATDIVRRRLAQLDVVDLEVLNAIAVLGNQAEESVLLEMLGRRSWASDAIHRLLRRSILVRPIDRPAFLRFQQPRLRNAVLDQIPEVEKRALHRRAGELAMAELGPDVADPDRLPDDALSTLARHFLSAQDLNAGRTFGTLAAARADHNQAWRQALQLYEQLIELAQHYELPQPPDVLEKIADLKFLLGQGEKALEIYEQLLNGNGPCEQTQLPAVPPASPSSPLPWDQAWLPRSNDTLPPEVRLRSKLSAACHARGDTRRALDILRSAIPLLPSDEVAARVRLLLDLALYSLTRGEFGDVEGVVDEALQMVGEHPSPWMIPSVIRLYCLVANAHIQRHRHDDAEKALLEGLRLADSSPDNLAPAEAREVQRTIGTLQFLRGRLLWTQEAYLESVRSTLDALERFEGLRDLAYIGKCYNNIGVAYFQLGEWNRAIDFWERFKDLMERIRAKNELVYACVNLGTMYKETGQFDKAAQTFEQGLTLARQLGYSKLVHTLTGNMGDVHARQGNFREARRSYSTALKLARKYEDKSEIAENMRRMADLSLQLRLFRRARREIAEGLEIARPEAIRIEEANLLALQGALAAESKQTDRALQCFRQAEALLIELNSVLERARLKYLEGIAFQVLAFPSEAENSLRFAEETFRRLGASWDLRRTRDALKRLGSDQSGDRLAFKKLQLLLDVTRSLGTELEIEPLLDKILEKALELTHTERGFILLLDEKGNPAFHSTRHMARVDVESGETAQISSTAIQKVLATGQALAVANVSQALDLRTQASIVALGLRSVVCTPLRRGERILGLIYVDSSRISEGFYQADVSLFEALADAAAISLENAQLIGALRRKNDLMSILAHEFRSPLTASISFTNQLLRESERISLDQRESLETILEQSHRLSRMINNVLELAQLEANKVEWGMEKLELDSILRATTRGLEPLAREKGVSVELRSSTRAEPVHGNPDRLIQVATNLLSNALKFAPAGGKVEVKTELIQLPQGLRTRGPAPPGGDTWATRTLNSGQRLSDDTFMAVRVADSGPGIPPEDLELIFGHYTQAGDSGQRKQGTGLGLAIAKEIINQHGGRIWAENLPSGGSVFVFCLPVVMKRET